MVVKVSDTSGEAWVSVFNEHAEKIIGCSADELDRIRKEVNSAIWVGQVWPENIEFLRASASKTKQLFPCLLLPDSGLTIAAGGRRQLHSQAQGSHLGSSPVPRQRHAAWIHEREKAENHREEWSTGRLRGWIQVPAWRDREAYCLLEDAILLMVCEGLALEMSPSQGFWVVVTLLLCVALIGF